MLGLKCPVSIHELVATLDTIKDKNYLTHNIHPYPAKYIPQIPACIIESYSKKGDLVLDPFCGSGTSLLEALIRGRSAVGLDVNPIATLIAKTKITVLDPEDRKGLLKIAEILNVAYEKSFSNSDWIKPEVAEDEIPEFLNRDHWFQKNVQRELAWLKKVIINKSRNETVKDYLKLCFSSIIVKVSNQDSETRWKAVKKDIPDGYAISLFINMLMENIKRSDALRELDFIKNKTQVITASVNEIGKFLGAASVDLIVTSPPYVNSFDYYLYHKLRMFWLDLDHKRVQSEEIGSRNKHCDNNETLDAFKDTMSRVMKNLRLLLKPDGVCVIVVGDSIYRGRIVDMGSQYIDIAKNAGLILSDMASFSQRKYSKAFTPNYKSGEKKTHILVFSSEDGHNKSTPPK